MCGCASSARDVWGIPKFSEIVRTSYSNGDKMGSSMPISLMLLLITIRIVHGFTRVNDTTISPGPPGHPGDKHVCKPVPDKPSSCACNSSLSGMVIDLSSYEMDTVNSSKPRFYAEGKPEGSTYGWYIAWSPCSNFDMFTNGPPLRPGEKACRNTGFALFTNGSSRQCTSFGTHEKSTHFKVTGTNGDSRIRLRMIFSYYDRVARQRNIAKIWLNCANKELSSPKLTFDERQERTVLATFTASCCCEGKCYTPPSKKKYESKIPWEIIGGSISGVVVLAGIIVYLKIRPCCQHLPFPIPVEFNQEQQDGEDERRPLLPQAS